MSERKSRKKKVTRSSESQAKKLQEKLEHQRQKELGLIDPHPQEVNPPPLVLCDIRETQLHQDFEQLRARLDQLERQLAQDVATVLSSPPSPPLAFLQ